MIFLIYFFLGSLGQQCEDTLPQILESLHAPLESIPEEILPYIRYSGSKPNDLGSYQLCNKIGKYALIELQPRIFTSICSPKDCQDSNFSIIPGKVHFPEQHEKDFLLGLSGGSFISIVCFLLSIVIVATIIDIIVERDSRIRVERAIWFEMALCFSLLKNTEILVTPKAETVCFGRNKFELVNISRILGVLFFDLSLTFSYLLEKPVIVNLEEIPDFLSSFTTGIYSFNYGVDFILLSTAFISTVSLLAELEEGGNLETLLIFTLVRALKVYFLTEFIMLGSWAMVKEFSSGPTWFMIEELHENCSETWWESLLFISNFFTESCHPVSKFIALDMQLFLLVPILLSVHYFSEKSTYIVSIVIWIACFFTNFFLIENLDLPEEIRYYFENVFLRPYTRGNMYVVFILIGILAFKDRIQDENDSITEKLLYGLQRPRIENLLFYTGLFLIIGVIIVQCVTFAHISEIKETLIVLGLNLSPLLVSFGLALIFLDLIFGVSLQTIGFIQSSIFVILEKLNLSNFLLYPIILTVYIRSEQQSFHLSNPSIWEVFIFIQTLSYLCSILLYLTLEQPISSILSYFKKKTMLPLAKDF